MKFVSDHERDGLSEFASPGFIAYKNDLRKIQKTVLTPPERNLYLVISMAQRYMNQGIPLLDLIQEGNMALIRTMERVEGEDPALCPSISSLSWKIRHAMRRLIENEGRTISLAVGFSESRRKVRQTEWHLAQKLNRQPSREEISEWSGIAKEEIAFLLAPPATINLDVSELKIDEEIPDDSGSTDRILRLRYRVRRALLEIITSAVKEKILTLNEARILKIRYFSAAAKVTDTGELGVREIAKIIKKSPAGTHKALQSAFSKLANSSYRDILNTLLAKFV